MVESFMREPENVDKMIEEARKRIELQNAEFEALSELKDRYADVCMTPVVEDDYPSVRHAYEAALQAFIKALKDNGRI